MGLESYKKFELFHKMIKVVLAHIRRPEVEATPQSVETGYSDISLDGKVSDDSKYLNMKIGKEKFAIGVIGK